MDNLENKQTVSADPEEKSSSDLLPKKKYEKPGIAEEEVFQTYHLACAAKDFTPNPDFCHYFPPS